MLGLNGDDPLALWPEAIGGLGLHLELVGHILAEAWYCQSTLGGVPFHHEGGG